MPIKKGSHHHWYKPELHLRSKHSANILQSPVKLHPLCEERKREVNTNGQIVSPVKRMEDCLETHTNLLQSSPVENKMHCSSFHTEMKYEGKYKYFKQSDGHNVTFLCWECEFQAKVEDVLRSHVRLHWKQFGESDFFYSCNLCQYNIDSKVQLEFHIKTCHKHKLYKQEMEVRKQEETEEVSDDDTDTDYSDVEFISDNEDFIGRAAANTEDIGSKDEMSAKHASIGHNMECSVCGRRFERESAFKKHMEWHTGNEKKYLCSYCQKTFANSTSRCKHEIQHKISLGLLKFKCGFCPQQYSKRRYLENHMKTKH